MKGGGAGGVRDGLKRLLGTNKKEATGTVPSPSSGATGVGGATASTGNRPSEDDSVDRKAAHTNVVTVEEDDESEGEEVKCDPITAEAKLEKFGEEKRHEKKWKSQLLGGQQVWNLTVSHQKGHISVMVFVEGTEGFARGWYRDIRIIFSILNLKDASAHITRDQVFRYEEKCLSHGWEDFVVADQVLKDKSGLYHGPNGEVSISLTVQILKEKGCSSAFRAGYDHDSFKATGFCGLKNQGATCYLNSLLQALYWIAPFRASVYKLPTEQDEPRGSIPLALQRLFYKLQFTNNPVSTTELTASFGWGTKDVFQQHDVQELNRVLQDKIEEKMKGTSEEGQVARLFRGKMVSYIKCLQVDYESKREEEFYDVSLVVKDCKNVYESFDKYTETELLKGDNQYRAEGHGLQDAERGSRFLQFPPVLHLQLKRFDFDLQRMTNYKIHSYYEFPRELDLSKYVDKNSPHIGDPAVYVLQGVMVHSGSAGGGHYYAFFRPTAKPRWFKFNDMRVTKATSEDAIEGNYGVDQKPQQKLGGFFSSPVPVATSTGGTRDPWTSAYMLQYVRKDFFAACVAPVPKSVVPVHINQRFEEEEREKERKRIEKSEAHLYQIVKVFDDEDLAQHAHVDLIDFSRTRPDHVFRVLKTTTAAQLKEQHLLALFKVDDPAKMRLRFFTRRRNGTTRASKLVSDETAELLKNAGDQRDDDGLKFLVEISQRTEAPFFDPPSTEAQVFFKYYDMDAKSLHYVGRFDLSRSRAPVSIEPALRAKVGLPSDVPLFYWEEVRWDPLRVDPLDQNASLEKLEVSNGDIIIFQRHPGDEVLQQWKGVDDFRKAQLTQSGHNVNPEDMALPLAKLYYQYIMECISVKFKHVRRYANDPGFSKMCIKSMGYQAIQNVIASHLGKDVCDNPEKIELTGHSLVSDKPVWNGPYKLEHGLVLEKMLKPPMTYYGASLGLLDTLYYEVLPFTLKEMREKLSVDTTVVDLKQNVVFQDRVVVSRDAVCGDLLARLRQQCPAIGPGQKLHIFLVANHRIGFVALETDPVSALLSKINYNVLVEYATEEDEEALSKHAIRVTCTHGEIDYQLRGFGYPFRMVVHRKETAKELRARIAKRFELSAEEAARWKLAVCERGFGIQPRLLKDDDHVDAEKWPDGTYLGVVHADRSALHHAHKETGLVIREVPHK